MSRLTPKQKVLKKYPNAHATESHSGRFRIDAQGPGVVPTHILAVADSEKQAWAAAARRLP